MSAVIYSLLLTEGHICSGVAELRLWPWVAGDRGERSAGPTALLPSSDPWQLGKGKQPGFALLIALSGLSGIVQCSYGSQGSENGINYSLLLEDMQILKKAPLKVSEIISFV